MKHAHKIRCIALILLSAIVLTAGGCDDHFFLSEREAAAFNSVLATDAIANFHLAGLQGRTVVLNFSNSSGSPVLQSTNLAAVMRQTELADLEAGPGPVSLARLASELEVQIGRWADDRLELYTSAASDERARLTRLDTVRLTFLSAPELDYRPENQRIGYQVSVRVEITGEIEVNAVNWFLDLFTNIDGTYPIRITLPELDLSGDAEIFSPYADAGRIRLLMRPSLTDPVEVDGNGSSIPDAVRDGVSTVFSHNVTRPVDHVFNQGYRYFSLPDIRLTPAGTSGESRLKVAYGYRAGWLGPDDARPELHIVSGAPGGTLLHSIRRDGRWRPYRRIEFEDQKQQLPSSKAGDPVLVHSGGGQLELAAIDTEGNLLYAHWRDENWTQKNVVAPIKKSGSTVRFRGRPAMIATAPGQVEIIAEGSDGELWHLRRIGGVWTTPVTLPLKNSAFIQEPIADPAAAFVGNKMVVVFADSQRKLAGIAFDLETKMWGQPTPFRSPARIDLKSSFAPAITASGGDSADVVFANEGRFPVHQRLEISPVNFEQGVGDTGITFAGNARKIGSTRMIASPVVVCATDRQPEVFILDQNRKVWHNLFFYALGPEPNDGRTINPGWQGWTVLEGGFRTAQPKYAFEADGISAAASRSGKAEIAAISKADGRSIRSRIFFKEFESARYGSKPWKTVGWRGWDLTAPEPYAGTPAIAVVDRNLQSVHMGQRLGFGHTVNSGWIAETNATHYPVSNQLVRSSGESVDPLVITSGPGAYDFFVIGADGRPVHTRHYSRGVSRPYTLQIPAGFEATSMSAVTYGNGAVEFAAAGVDGKVFVWRFRGGDWSPAVPVGADAASAPALVYLGDGTIELYFVSSAGALVRRRFSNGEWGVGEKVSSNVAFEPRLFSARSVASWGDGTVDVVLARSGDGRLFHRRFVTEYCPVPSDCPKRVFTDMGGSTKEDPVLAAFSDVHLVVLSMRGLSWFSSVSGLSPAQSSGRLAPPDPVLKWSGPEPVGGSEMVIGAVAHSGPANVTAVATAAGELFVLRAVNGRWTGFRPVSGQESVTVLRMPILLPSIDSYGSG